MDMISRSFRLESCTPIRLGRSNSTLLASELVSSEVAKIFRYERVSQSMKIPVATAIDNCGGGGGSYFRWSKIGARVLLNKVFSYRKSSEDHVICRGATAGKKSNRRAVSMPNPYRRWPVQGW